MARRTTEEAKALIRQMRRDGKCTIAIADALSKSRHAILRQESRMGMPRRKRGFPPNPEIAERNKRICQAIDNGVNRAVLAERYKLSKSTINVIYSTRSRDQEEKNSANEAE